MDTSPSLAGYELEQEQAWAEALARNVHALFHIGQPLAAAVELAARDCAQHGRVSLDELDGRGRRRTRRAARELALQVWGSQHCGPRLGCQPLTAISASSGP